MWFMYAIRIDTMIPGIIRTTVKQFIVTHEQSSFPGFTRCQRDSPLQRRTGRLPLWQYPIMYFNRKHRAAQDRPNTFLHSSSVSISRFHAIRKAFSFLCLFFFIQLQHCAVFPDKASLALPLPESIGPQITLSASSM